MSETTKKAKVSPAHIHTYLQASPEDRHSYAGTQLPLVGRSALQEEAMKEAYKRVYQDHYRHMIRYEPREFQQLLALTDGEVEDLETMGDRVAASRKPVKYVVIGLPKDAKQSKNVQQWRDKIVKQTQRVYVGKCHVTYEQGTMQKHPHYNILFIADVESLETGRILREWSQSLGIDKQYIDVSHRPMSSWKSTLTYMRKEKDTPGYVEWNNYSSGIKKSKKVLKIVEHDSSDDEQHAIPEEEYTL